MKVAYLEPAKRDFERFRDFLRANDLPEDTINHILGGVIDKISALKDSPMLGFSIGARYGYQTSYRGYITDPYIAVYEIAGDTVEIRRVYHQKEDYIRDILVLEP